MSPKTAASMPFPKAPAGTEACRVRVRGGMVTHLVALDESGSNGGRPTLCGLTRFDGGTTRADLPGWGMGDSGVRGPRVVQITCDACYRTAPVSTSPYLCIYDFGCVTTSRLSHTARCMRANTRDGAAIAPLWVIEIDYAEDEHGNTLPSLIGPFHTQQEAQEHGEAVIRNGEWNAAPLHAPTPKPSSLSQQMHPANRTTAALHGIVYTAPIGTPPTDMAGWDRIGLLMPPLPAEHSEELAAGDDTTTQQQP